MIIKGGRVIDPRNKVDGIFDILIKGGKIEKVAGNIDAKGPEAIDAQGKIVAPGLIDMHVHLREPGREDMETVASGTRAAVAGGVTTVSAMPNTQPAMDSERAVKYLNDIIAKDASANVFIVGAITKARAGSELVDIKALKAAGVAALSDDGNSIQDDKLMLEALKEAKKNGLLITSHCEDSSLSSGGVVNEGVVATKLGLKPISRKSEYAFVRRDIGLAKKAKAAIHIAHVSTKESVDIIRKAKKTGQAVTAETTPHHFSLWDSCCETYDTRTKMYPPLRSKEDVEAIIRGLADGTIDAIATDHAPHGKHEKEIEFDQAAFGIIGLETSLALALTNLVYKNRIKWPRLIEIMSANPASILGLKAKGSFSRGADADIVIIDPKKEWTYKKGSIVSKSKNSPFIDWQFKGKVTDVVIGGKSVLRQEALT
jgi:dihydroorotase